MPRTMKYYPINGPVKELPDDELRRILGEANNAELIRSIAINERDHLTDTEPRTLRSFWYSTVKPVLSRLGKLGTMTAEKTAKWDQELSRHLKTLVELGDLTYADLNILDRSRSRAIAEPMYEVASSTYQYRVTDAEHPNIILCTEKDTAIPILQQVASITGCSWLSGGGQNAFAAMESLLHDITQTKRVQEIQFLSITDYDYSGFSIANTFRKQAESLSSRFGIHSVEADRLGIWPQQITQDEINQNAYYVAEKHRVAWMEQTGGIDGEPLGLELDAYTPSRLRQVLVQGLSNYINGYSDETAERLRDSYARKVALSVLSPFIEKVLDDVVAKESDKVTVDMFDVLQLAKQGFKELPVDVLCEHERVADIIERVRRWTGE